MFKNMQNQAKSRSKERLENLISFLRDILFLC